MDLIRKLGPLALASRLKRLAEWLYKDGARIYRVFSVDFEPRWFPLFYLLNEVGVVSVTEAAQMLGLSHPAINQIAGEMFKRGLLTSTKDKKDERKHILRLTKKGKEAVSSLEPVWAEIKVAANELLEEAGGDFLATLGKLEDLYNKTGIYERVVSRLKKRQLEKIEIVQYKPQFKRYFRSLNLEWLREYFAVEDEDERILSDPYGEIIKKGGMVLFAKLNSKIVGTVALLKHNKQTFELAKMAVAKEARGQQVGRKLALAVIERAKRIGAEKIVLLTSPRLEAAGELYRSLGFKEMAEDQRWITSYLRGGIPMSLDLRKETIKINQEELCGK